MLDVNGGRVRLVRIRDGTNVAVIVDRDGVQRLRVVEAGGTVVHEGVVADADGADVPAKHRGRWNQLADELEAVPATTFMWDP